MEKQGQVALVTGAAGGFGQAIVKKLLERGYVVHGLDYHREHLKSLQQSCSTYARELHVHVVNLELLDEVEIALQAVFEISSYVNILVNCAGVCTGTSIWEMSQDEWDKTYAINVRAPFFLSQLVSKQMISLEVEPRRIINISSLVSFTGGILSSAAYSSSKAALSNTTKNFAKALACHNITVNEVSPGTADTEMARNFIGNRLEGFKERIPLGRLCTPEDVANAVMYFTSDEASYVTGQVIHVDGGMYCSG